MLTSEEIKKIIPHRYPFLLVDKVVELEPGIRAVGIKNVSFNEPYFQGHFPDFPVMPGVLITEALAQTAGIAVNAGSEGAARLGLFASIDSMKFKKQVVPGDRLRLTADILSSRMNVVKAGVEAEVDGAVVAEGIIRFVMIPKDV